MLTKFLSYGQVSQSRRAEIIRGISDWKSVKCGTGGYRGDVQARDLATIAEFFGRPLKVRKSTDWVPELSG